MEQYISKSALVAEIERQISAIDNCPKLTDTQIAVLEGNKVVLTKLFSSLNTLEVKEVQEEPVSKDLEEASRNYADNEEYGDDVYYAIKAAFKAGTKWQKEHLWKSADGDDLPEYEREVVAFQEIFPTDVDVSSLLKVVITHRPNPDGWDGKSLATGKI